MRTLRVIHEQDAPCQFLQPTRFAEGLIRKPTFGDLASS